ncbi:MAG TPA: hypothetical protein VIH59_27720 [Candidatus Tectomicrobia bacterium]|jgi:hypothetical protein
MVTQRANGVTSSPAQRLATGFVCATSLVGLLALGMLWALPATARHKPVIFVGIVEPPQVDAETGLFVGEVSRLYDILEKLRNNPAALGLASSAVTIQLAEHAIYRLDPSQAEAGRVQLAARTGRAGTGTPTTAMSTATRVPTASRTRLASIRWAIRSLCAGRQLSTAGA